MPKSSDPQRAGGRYMVRWIDDKGKTHAAERATVGQARKLMQHRKSQGYTAWMNPIK